MARLRPVVDALLAWFGPARLMWGSDWPVLTLAASYAEWVAVSDDLFGALSPDERAQVLHGNAQRFYGLH
jgi:L-fuconolactonase